MHGVSTVVVAAIITALILLVFVILANNWFANKIKTPYAEFPKKV